MINQISLGCIGLICETACEPRNVDKRSGEVNGNGESDMMKLDLKGRVNNAPLSPYRKNLIPLFEAVVNSIHAIQELKNGDGFVHVAIERDGGQKAILTELDDTRPIYSFIITDNGVGFDENNYESFETADTTYKASRMAKGVGCMSWLKAFDKVEVKSVFRDNGSYKERSFDFIVSGEGIERANLRTLGSRPKQGQQTEVRLIGYKPAYQKHCPKSIQVIAERLLEHCIIFFLSPQCPNITISDGKDTVNLNDLFIAGDYVQDTFVIKNENFSIHHLKLYASGVKLNKLHLCAAERTVYSRDISKRIPNLGVTLLDDSNRPFRYAAIVQGSYLDNHVSEDRTGFDFSDRLDDEGDMGSLFADTEITRDEIENHALAKTKSFLGGQLESINEDKLERVKNHINNVTPEFRPVLKYKPDKVDELRPDLSQNELTAALHRIYHEMRAELKERTDKILTAGVIDDVSYKAEHTRLVDELSDVSKHELAQHVIHRKLILDLFENILKRNEKGKYNREEVVHNLIYPRRKESGEVFDEQQNLWIIDEKLNYHRYLYSDLEMYKMKEVVKTKSAKRPDVVIFNQITLASDDSPHDSVVILEFKKPMRTKYDEKKEPNPIDQALNYIDDLEQGKVLDEDGRKRIKVKRGSTLYFVYIICDPTNPIKEYARKQSFKTFPGDEDSFFHYHDNYRAWIEIISFDKLLSDAKKRNRVLFEKLNLPYS